MTMLIQTLDDFYRKAKKHKRGNNLDLLAEFNKRIREEFIAASEDHALAEYFGVSVPKKKKEQAESKGLTSKHFP